MDTSSSGSETQSREMATSVCAQFVSRADARQSAIQGTLEERSLSATTAHKFSNLHWQSWDPRTATPDRESKRH